MTDGRGVCDRCGLAHPACSCDFDDGATGSLRLLEPPVADRTGPTDPERVRLVREFKGPTVEDLAEGGDDVDLLPGRTDEVLRQIETGNLEAADRELDAAAASVHRGPGFRRRQHRTLVRRLALGLAFATVVAIVVAAMLR